MKHPGVRSTLLVGALAFLAGAPACSSSATPSPPAAAADAGAGAADAASADAGPPLSADGLYPLAGTDRALPRGDLAPIGRLAKDATAVGLGESIHTSGGFYDMKVRVLEYLVAELGYRAIEFETPWAGADDADAYVQTCTGTADDATRKLHTIWWATSVRDLLAFLCEWNKAHPSDRVRFGGWDIRQPWIDAPALRAFLKKASPADETRLMDGLSRCLGVGFADERAFFTDPKTQALYGGQPMSDDDRNACAAGITAARTHLETNQAQLTSATSAPEYQRARLRVVGMGAFNETIYHYIGRDGAKGQEARDVAMFDVWKTLRAQRGPQVKTGIWAHNLHLTRRNPEIEAAAYPKAITFGTLVDRELGARYVPIGLIGYKVSIDWHEGPKVSSFSSSKSIEKKLHDSGATLSFLDLTTPVEAPFAGDASYEVSTERMKPSQHYAGLVYIDAPKAPAWVGGTAPFPK